MICWKCNSQIPDEAIFCDNCGAEQHRIIKCRNCGAELLNNPLFCKRCGTPTTIDSSAGSTRILSESYIPGNPVSENKPAAKAAAKNSSKSTLISAGIAVALALALLSTNMLWLSGAFSKSTDKETDSTSITDQSETGSEDQITDTNMSFSTPEDTIDYFAKCMSSEDSEGALQAFAISEQASGYDAEKYMDRLQCYFPMMLSPGGNSTYNPLNEGILYGRASAQIQKFIYSFILPTAFTDGYTLTIPNMPMGVSETVTEMLDTSKIRNVTLVRADEVSPDIQQSEQNQKNFTITAKCFGADGVEDYVALYELDGEYYVGGFFLLEYNGSWKIQSLNSLLAGTSSAGNVIRTTKADYMDMISGYSSTDSSYPDSTDGTNSYSTTTAATTAAATTAP